jgi:hypothetical protein
VINARLISAQNPQNGLKINGEGEIAVTMHQHPPLDEVVEAFPFAQWFTADGASSGSNDLRVDGSVNPQKFYISARSDVDLFIKTISVRISDAGATLDEFGNLPALTNGVSFEYISSSIGDLVIQDQIQTNLDFIRLGVSTPAIGGGTDAFKADLTGGGADTYLPVIDLSATFGFVWGLHLKKGTLDRIQFTVNDDLSTGIDTLNIRGFGSQL